MVSGSRIEGGTQILSAQVRNTIQSIKEIVKNHSDAEIYVTLKETNMDPDETAQKLLNQDFHPFYRMMPWGNVSKPGLGQQNTGYKSLMESRKPFENAVQGITFNTSDCGVRREDYNRNAVAGLFFFYVKIFVVVYVLQGNQYLWDEELGTKIVAENGSSREFRAVRDNRINQITSREMKPPSPQRSTFINEQVNSCALVMPTISSRDTNSSYSIGKELREEGRSPVPTAVTGVQGSRHKPHSAVREYSSSSDPVHVRSTDSRSAVTIGDIERQLWAVGVCHQSSEHSVKPFLNYPGIIGTPAKSVLHPTENPKDSETDAAQVQDKPSWVNNYENQNVVIAEHIRVTESDHCQLTFGSFGTEIDSSRDFVSESHTVGNAVYSSGEPSTSLSASAPESSSDEPSACKHVDLPDDQIRNSCSNSTASGVISENELLDKKESSSPQKLDGYADIGLVHNNSASYTPFQLQQQQDAPELASLSAYDAQSGYDIPYIRPTMDETIRGQVLPSPWEALSSHAANSNPASMATMLLQQHQPTMPQMYPQDHVSRLANLVPYRQFLSPVYVPSMQMAGYSSNAIYPHPSNGSSYLLLPGCSFHLSANSLKYQQFKPVPASSPTGGLKIHLGSSIKMATFMFLMHRLRLLKFGFRIQGSFLVCNPHLSTICRGQTPHASYLPSHAGNASFNAAAAQSSHSQFPGMYPPPPPQPAAIANPHHLGPGMGAPAAPGTQVGAYQHPQLGHLNWTTNF
ncbi:dentin sialophosphoprotein, putative [Actinidia rufa]|uniref:Dentin sialophosphoprotein, putative n=1 Tax=Actinidia rufa TaxID=165716 RepID=A0A7J0G0D7_9ERIC|nr:dentin sialophosphoprotein, putative [Actinidia rufa]